MGEQSYGPPASASIANAAADGPVRDHGGGLDAAEARFGQAGGRLGRSVHRDQSMALETGGDQRRCLEPAAGPGGI